MDFSATYHRTRNGFKDRGQTRGITLVEIVIAMALIGTISVGVLMSFSSANRLGIVDRSLTYARELCQDRIEQMVSQSYSPSTTIPTLFGAWPIPATNTTTATETVPIYSDISGATMVNGTRTTIVSRPDANLNYVLVTVRVNYTFRGTNYQQEINTVRAPD
jgi:type II secretory pathway pseudopilin PulG